MYIYFIQFAAIAVAGFLIDANASKKKARQFLIFSFGLLILLSALRSQNIGTDLAVHYAKRYTQISSYEWSEIPQFAKVSTYEIGYCYLMKALSVISPDIQFFIVSTSIFTLGTVGWFIYRNSCDVKMSTYVFVLTCTYYNYMNIVRQAIAISIVLIGYEILKKPKNKIVGTVLYILIVMLAATVHASSVFCLLFILFSGLKFREKELLTSVIITVIVFVFYEQILNVFLKIFGVDYYGYLTKEVESVGHFNIQSVYMLLTIAAAFILGCITMIIKKGNPGEKIKLTERFRKLSLNESFLLYTGLFATICRLMVFRMNIINRFSYFLIPFVLLLYPAALYGFRLKANQRKVKIFIYLFLGVYFVWMTISYEALFHRTVPYEFFWQMQ